MKKRIKKIQAASSKSKLIGMSFFVLAFAGIGGLIVLRSRAAPGVCSTTNVIGSATYSVAAPETAQYRLWVRMQVPDTTNTNNLNGVRVEIAGASNQCFTVTTTSSAATTSWQWVNSDATASSTAHVTSSISAGNYTAKILGLRAGVKVDKVLLLRSDNTCTPDNVISGTRQPGDNCTTPAPTVTISANPTSVASGGSSTLTWSSTNATTCSGSGAWGTASRATSGTFSATNITANSTYTITCTGVGGTSSPASATVTVTAPPAPVVTLTANPTQVISGSASTLTWTVTNTATTCTAGNGWSGSKSVTGGSESTGNLTANRTYTLVCTGPGGTSNTATTTVTVTATPPPTDTQPPTITMGLPGVTVPAGQSSVIVRNLKTVTWQPLATDASGVASVTYSVNGQNVTLSSGQYVFGSGARGVTDRNNDYQLTVTASDTRGNATTATFTVRLRHPDIDRSGVVNILDIGILTRSWNQASTAVDLNVDGTVNILDVGILTRSWNSTQ